MKPFVIDESIRKEVVELLEIEKAHQQTIAVLSLSAYDAAKRAWTLIKETHPQAQGDMNFNADTLTVTSIERKGD